MLQDFGNVTISLRCENLTLFVSDCKTFGVELLSMSREEGLLSVPGKEVAYGG